ncbi:MAG: hypothetical protein QG597_4753 [Actinomycetota bacterium]|nr:hypothetical protein [Actinomycetota bacterium]
MTMNKRFTVRITGIDGDDPMMDSAGMQLLYGVTADEIRALFGPFGTGAIPPEWIKRSRRRHKEAAAATGSEDLDDALTYWARKDHNAELDLVVT